MMKASFRTVGRRIPFVRYLARQFRSNVDIYRDKIESDEHNNVVLSNDGIPIPPIRLRDMVRRGAIMAEDFILEGRQVHGVVVQVAAETGEPIVPSMQILEFGVGCGRVARHFLAAGAENFIGTDVDAELIDWCTTNLPGTDTVQFFTNGYEPPIPVTASSQDLVYAISVFTHMDEQNQKSWANELGRIVRPDGRLLVSFLERALPDLPGGVEARERIDPEYVRTWFGKDGAPSVYFSTYNTKEYLETLFGEHFEPIAYRPKIVRKHQSILVLRKT